MSERRQYFRINDTVSLKYSIIEKETYDNEIININNDQHKMVNMLNTLNVLDSKLLILVEQLKQESPTMAEALNILNKKTLIMSAMLTNADNDAYAITQLEDVNLSANGIAFQAKDSIVQDTYLKLEIVLVPEYHYCVVYGRVLNCIKNEEESSYSISVQFEGINNNDKEKIIQHVMKKQSEELREQRQPKLSAV